jgi:PUA domain protein
VCVALADTRLRSLTHPHPISPPRAYACTRTDPTLLPRVGIDRGAIRFLLAGAHMMCPGLTSRGGFLPATLAAGSPVAIFAEGKEAACGVGVAKMSADEMRRVNKDVAVESVAYLGDELWAVQKL